MFSQFRIALGFVLLLSLVFAVPVFAGGWAVITLDELPTGAIAGEPLTVGFTVLQHGRTPMEGLVPTITASLSNDQEVFTYAKADGEPGHYTATLTFPQEGDWSWSIQAFTMDQPMPVLSVAAPAVPGQPVTKSQPEPVAIAPLWIVRGLAAAVALLGLVLAYRRKSRLALALTVAAVAVGVASFMMGSAVPKVEASSEGASDPAISQAELGEQLFIAKGCITCHVNNKVDRAYNYWTIDMGATNLTKFSASPEVLRMRLKDPASVKSDTKMPQLNLSEAEIEALIAFINSK